LDVINKTVALSDLNTFLNENNVDDIIESLIYYGSKFNRSMVLILQSMPPIRNENTLDRLYELAIDYVNPTVLEALRNAGHVPLTNDQLEALKATLPENDDRETRQHVNRFIAIFNTIKPAAETETSYLIHSLEKYNNTRSLTPENIKYMRLNQDNIEDIYSHLKAIANDESTNKSDDDGVAAEAAGY
jgi:hypothetical protein